jgi:DnaJ like chaperone protein
MKWTGKIVGGVIGAVFGPWGVAIGALLGHQYDVHSEPSPRLRRGSRRSAGGASSGESVSEYADIGGRFFSATFQVMGRVAKADGRVSEAEINAARAVMDELKLDREQVQAAIQQFTRGKDGDFDLDMTVLGLRRTCADRPDVLRVFLEIQLRAAIEGTDLQDPQRKILLRCASLLQISPLEFAHMEAVLRIRRATRGGQSGGQGSGQQAQASSMQLAQAYEVLEVEASATDEDVVKAYRRQLSKHHPDKLKANGLPDSMLEHAKQRTQQIIEAYDLVREHRGIA